MKQSLSTLILALSVLVIAVTATKLTDNDTITLQDTTPKSLLSTIGSTAWAIFCVVGPILQYYPTIPDVLKLSPYVICILIVSNIIRIFYWVADPFELSLLLQSVVMIGMMIILLLELTKQLKSQYKSDREKYKKMTIWSVPFNLDTFWLWTDFQSYQLVLSGLVTVLIGGYLFFNEQVWYGKMLGFLALLIEAMLGVPQVIKNIKTPQGGQSPVLFLTWLGGDLAKTGAFIATGAPLPFVACGLLQTITDIVILVQILVILPKEETKKD